MKNKIIIPTGYMGTGSSAISDIAYEIYGTKEVRDDRRSFEYVFLHCPNGVFDLEDKLLKGNNILRSDEAIHSFLDCMHSLYRTPFYWPSGYYKMVSRDFYVLCKNFIDGLGLITYEDGYWYYQERPQKAIMYIKAMLQQIKRVFCREKNRLTPPLIYEKMILAYPNQDIYYMQAKKFLNQIFDRIGIKEQSIIMDQLLLPHNLFRLNKYFDDNVRVIVVDRDPRDIFILNKYYWSRSGGMVPYPFDVKKYCEMYKAQRKMEIVVNDRRILRLHFEDLIYYYEKTLTRIYDFLDISREEHTNKGKYFNPEVSINNTQVFRRKKVFYKEAEYIERELTEFIYQFPKIPVVNNADVVF